MDVFEQHRAKKAAKAYQGDLARWETERAGYAELLEVAQSYQGSVSGEIMLGAGEARTFLTRDVCRSLGRVGKRAPLP